MKSSQRRATLIVSGVALALTATGLSAQARPEPPQRGGPPNNDTPYILVPTFLSNDRQAAVQAGDELRRRLAQEHTARELYVIPRNSIVATLEASGYRADSALSANDVMELAKQLRGEYVTDGKVTKTGNGNAVRMEVRILMRSGPQLVLAQPLPVVEGKDVGDAVKQVSKSINEALKQMPMYRECIAALRGGRWDEAAAKARAGIAAYPNASFSRICLLNSYTSSNNAPPDSIISVANQILEVDPNSMIALANLADAYRAKGDRDKATEMNLRIYRLDPSNQAVAQSIVQELAQSGAPDKALPIIDSLMKDNPGDPGMLRTKWLLQLRVGRFKEAMATGEELVRVDTAAATVDYFNRQIGAAQSDSNTAKITEFASKAAQKFPNDASFPLLLAQTYRKTGQLQQAMQHARRATEIDAKDTRAWLLAIATANELNQPDTAMSLAQKALSAGADRDQIGPVLLGPAQAAVNKAQASKSRGDWADALAKSEVVDSIAPSNESKFFVGVSSFQVGYDIVTSEIQPLTKSTKPAERAKACALSKEAEGYLAKTSTAMPQGGRVNPEVASQILSSVGSITDFLGEVKKAFCK